MLKLLYLAELVVINLKYIASNTSLMMSLSIGYLQILALGYPGSKFTIHFNPTSDTPTFKTNALCLVSNEEWLKRLLLLYKRIIQPYLSLIWL